MGRRTSRPGPPLRSHAYPARFVALRPAYPAAPLLPRVLPKKFGLRQGVECSYLRLESPRANSALTALPRSTTDWTSAEATPQQHKAGRRRRVTLQQGSYCNKTSPQRFRSAIGEDCVLV